MPLSMSKTRSSRAGALGIYRRRFTLLTLGFSKKIENHMQALALVRVPLQFLQDSQDAALHASNGSGCQW
jgi:hypothetical protein